MILQSLVKYYKSLEKEGKIEGFGWGTAKVSDRIVLDKQGKLLGIISAKNTNGKGKKEIPTIMNVPEQVKRSSGIAANFLCDTSTYILGMDGKGKSKRAADSFAASKKLHHEILDGLDSEIARAILHFYDHWDLEKEKTNKIILENKDEIETSPVLLFQVEGLDAQKDEVIRNAWIKYRSQTSKNTYLGQCLVTGEQNVPIAKIHPNIKGVRDAQSSGASLVSFNAPAFESYGHDKEQGLNAPISEYAAFSYTTALNYLLSHEYSLIIGDTTVAYWSEHGENLYQDLFGSLLGGEPKGLTDDEIRKILQKIIQGESVSLKGIFLSQEEPFYVLGLAPNAARLSIRFFYKNTFGNVIQHLQAHQQRLKIIKPSWEKENIPLWKLLKATVNPNAKDSVSSPLLAGSLLRSILGNTKYPESMFQNILLRIFADSDDNKISYVKSAFIKAYLLKNHKERWGGKITMKVNPNCKEKAYILGRIFAVLEGLQQAANPTINTTIKDRYFNSACATPAVVFPTLLKLANAHLAKLDKGQQIYQEKKIGDLLGRISMPDTGNPIPSRLTLEEQGVFVLGYYQETQDRYTKKGDKENE